MVQSRLTDGQKQDGHLRHPTAARDGVGSIQTSWALLHRYRSVMVRPGRDRLHGDVEVDESFLGGPEPGVPGRGALGKVLFAGAVELDDKGCGRARLGVISAASAVSLSAFLDANVEPGSRVMTDGWSAYPAATRDRYEHTGTSVAASGLQAHEVLPAVHRVFSLVKRWIIGTMQGSVSPEHVQAYFDEWVFRFNRRHSRSRGLLFHTLLQNSSADGWAFKRFYASDSARRITQPGWLHEYNHDRPHTAIGKVSPTTRLTNVAGQYSSRGLGSAAAVQQGRAQRPQQDRDVTPQGPVFDVVVVEAGPVRDGGVSS